MNETRDKNILKMDYPASWWAARWREALPAGNGRIGAAVYGDIYEETIMLTHEDLWCHHIKQKLPDVSDKLPQVRQALSDHRFDDAQYIFIDALKHHGYRNTVAYPLPLGDLKILMPARQAFKEYNRTLNMETGEITVSWKDGRVRYDRALFVSRADDVVVCSMTCNGQGAINARIGLDLHDRLDAMKPSLYGFPGAIFSGEQAPVPRGFEAFAKGPYLFYAAQNDDGTDFGAVAKIALIGGHCSVARNSIQIEQADRIVFYVKIFIKSDRHDEWTRLEQALSAMTSDYDELLHAHTAVHQPLFCATTLDLDVEPAAHARSNEELLLQAYKGETPLAMVEKMWAYGRYLLISSSHPGGHPCPLLGLWGGEYQGFWSFNMANENLQMMYWQALSGNMPELLMAVFDYYDRMLDDFRTNARHIYGCRGIFIPAVTTPCTGIFQDLQPHLIHWTGAAGWLAQHYYDYYLFTGDETFLRDRALPFLKETALFYEDFFVLDDDGSYLSAPSNSPENKPGNYEGLATTMNATMDFAIAKEVLTHLIEGAEIAGLYSEEIPKWQEMLTHIPPYQINADGAIKEWMSPLFDDNYHHRHQSHLYPVFPGTEITQEEQPEVFHAFVTAVKKRLVIGLQEQTAWSLAHMACTYARMGEGELAAECLDILSRSTVMKNFFTVHNDWRKMGVSKGLAWSPFQIDANMGWTAAVQEMLLFSKPGLIKLLPALPARWTRGKVTGLLCRGGIRVDIDWDMKVGSITTILISNTTQRISITLPRPIQAVSVNGEIHHAVREKSIEDVQLDAGIAVAALVTLQAPGQSEYSAAERSNALSISIPYCCKA